MAKIYKFSSLMSVKDFGMKIMSTIDDEDTSRERKVMDEIKTSSEMGITCETLTELKDVCSPSNLKCEDDPTNDIDDPDIATLSNLTNLTTLKYVESIVSQKKDNYSDPRMKIFDSRNRNYISLSEVLRTAEIDTNDKVDGTQVVLSVALYHPVKFSKVQEFLVLGCQTLAELRDKIYCPADSVVVGEHSENPELAAITTAKDICPSGFMFIESVFYNDTRSDLSRDYSKIIMDWTNKQHKGELPRFGVCSSKKMEETKFEDLAIKLGYPYVYAHQGNCEHVLMFRDLRLLHADDPQSLSNYPLQIFRPRPKRRTCMICSIYSARWLTRNDPLMSEDPSLFCEKCFKSLHYKDNQKAYDFNAYQYPGDYYW